MTGWRDTLANRVTDAAGARIVLNAARPFYVYVLCRSDGTPFYVGKGVGLRIFQHEAEARNSDRLTHKLNVIRSTSRRGESIRYCVESSFTVESEALARERELIALFGRSDRRQGPLTNQTDGGEGASNPSEESRERRRENLAGVDAGDDQRRIANRFFQELCSVASVPVKPLSRFKPERLHANRSSFAMSPRQAAALAASAIANRVMLVEGAILPRRMSLNGVPMVIENGVGRDMLSSGMVTLVDDALGRETLKLTTTGFRYVLSIIDRNTLLSAGITDPLVTWPASTT